MTDTDVAINPFDDKFLCTIKIMNGDWFFIKCRNTFLEIAKIAIYKRIKIKFPLMCPIKIPQYIIINDYLN